MELSTLLGNLCVFVISAAAAFTDIKAWRVSNLWLALWSAAGFANEFIFFGGENLLSRCVGAVIPLLILGVFFVLRMIGAGDVKLLCTLGIWLGASDILLCMLFAFALGAAVSIVMIMRNKNSRQRFVQLGRYCMALLKTGAAIDYGARSAGRARVKVSVFVFAAVLIKIMGVY